VSLAYHASNTERSLTIVGIASLVLLAACGLDSSVDDARWRWLGSSAVAQHESRSRSAVHAAPGEYAEGLEIERSLSIVRDDFDPHNPSAGGDVIVTHPLEAEWVVRISDPSTCR
jgi:hypothetical protein